MRTTLTLDPDVAQKLQARMAERQESLKQVVNQALRIGLSAPDQPAADRFVVEPYAFSFLPGIDRDKMNQLVDELEVEEFLEREARQC